MDAGVVADASSLGAWLADLVGHGSIRQDATLLGAAWRAVRDRDDDALCDANALALALCAGRERRLETSAMGNAFVTVLRTAWPTAAPAALGQGDIAYPVAVGSASAAEGLDLGRTIEAFALAVVAALVSAAVRLGAIGQTDGQRLTIGAMPAVRTLAAAARVATLDDLGGCALRSDLAALQHETQYSRLFRS